MKEVREFLQNEARLVISEIEQEKRNGANYIANFKPGQPPYDNNQLQRLSTHLNSIQILINRTAVIEKQAAAKKAEVKEIPKVEGKAQPLNRLKRKSKVSEK